MSRSSSIRDKCIDCCAGQASEVRLCTAIGCPLWPFRFGVGGTRVKRDHPELLMPEKTGHLGAGTLGMVRYRGVVSHTVKNGG